MPLPTKVKTALVATVVGFVLLAVDTLMPPVPESKLTFLSKGSTTNEVLAIFGTPRHRSKSGRHWRYQPRLRMGYFDLHFDERGRLIDYNFERF